MTEKTIAATTARWFSKGRRVEVSDKKGACYVATVVDTPVSVANSKTKRKTRQTNINSRNNSNSYLIEYEALLWDESKHLRERVDVSLIRPLPPTTTDDDRLFELNDVVDAFHQDGWWCGVVVDRRVVDHDRDASIFVVRFSHPPDLIEFRRSELRPHLVWVGSRWVRPGKNREVLAPLLGDQEKLEALLSSAHAIEMDIQLEPSDTAENDTKPKQAISEIDTKQIFYKSKAGNAEDGQSPITPCPSMEISTDISDTDVLSSNITATKGGLRTDHLKESAVGDQLSAKSNSPSRKKVENKQDVVNALVSGSIKISGRKRSVKDKPYAKRFHSSSTGKGGNARTSSTEEFVEKELILEDAVSVKEQTGSQAKTSHQLAEVRDHDPHVRKPENIIKEINEGGESQQRKKRGRPRKLPAVKPKASVEGERNKEAAGALNEMVVKDGATNVAEVTAIVGMGTSGSGSFSEQPFMILSRQYQKFIAGEHNQITDTVPRKRAKQLGMNFFDGRQQMSTPVNARPPIQDSQQAPEGKTSEVFKVDSIAKVDRVIGASDGEVLVHCNEASDGQIVMLTSPCAVVANSCIEEKCENKLPFQKSSPVWNMIESLQVFQKTPQSPHFSPLINCKEESREGLAIGHMVTFANVVERTSQLQFTDPKSVIESSLETLIELEDLGFDVEVVRVRLNELLSLKDRVGQLEAESKQVESEIVNHTLERTLLEMEINEVEMKMRELKEKLSSAVPMKELKDEEIARLQSKADFIVGNVGKAKLDYETIAASPW